MATLDEARAQFEEFAKRMGYSAEESARGLAQLQISLTQSSNRATAFAQALNSAAAGTRQQGAAAASVASEMRKAAAQAKAAGSSSEEIRRDMEKLANSINANIDDPRMRASIQRYARSQADAAERTESYQRALSMVSAPLKGLGSVVGSTFSAYQGGSSQIGISAALLQAEAELAGKGLQGLGRGAQGLGTALQGAIISGTPLGAILSGVGTALRLGGVAAEMFGQGVEAAAKLLPRIAAEIEKNISSFQSLSSSGALYSNGLTQMVKTAGYAGLTLDQLAKVVAANKDALSSLGEGVTGGVNRLARVMNTGGDTLKKNLLNLGYTIEEQAGLVAETMRDMRQTGSKLPQDRGTEALIASQTQKYAENLRILADISGEDVKSKTAAARQAASQLAFQQEINKLSPAMRKAAQDSMANMTQQEKQLYMEKFVNNGQALTQGSAVLASQLPELNDSMDEIIASVRNGTGGLDTAMQIQARHQAGINQQIQGLDTAIGLSGIMGLQGPAAELSNTLSGLNGVLMENSRRTQEAYDRAREAATRQGRPEDQGGRNDLQTAMTDMILQNQKLNVELDQATKKFGLMAGYMNAAEAATRGFISALNSFSDQFSGRSRAPTPQAEEAAAAIRNRQEETRLTAERAQLLRNMNEEERRQFEEINRTGRGPNGEIPQSFFEQLARRQGVTVPTRSTTPTPPSIPPIIAPPANMTPEQRAEWQRTHPGQQIPPATPAASARPPTPDLNTGTGQRAAADAFYNGGATALPNGPTPPETEEQRQARLQREQNPAPTSGTPARTETEIRQRRVEDATAAAAPVVAEVQRLAALMTDVNRHLENIDRNISGVNQNTGALVHLQ